MELDPVLNFILTQRCFSNEDSRDGWGWGEKQLILRWLFATGSTEPSIHDESFMAGNQEPGLARSISYRFRPIKSQVYWGAKEIRQDQPAAHATGTNLLHTGSRCLKA